MTKDNDLVSGLLGGKFNLEMMVPQRSKEAIKEIDGKPVSLPVTIPQTQNNIDDRDSMDSTLELNMAVIHQLQIPV